MSKYLIVTLMAAFLMMGRMWTFLKIKMLQRQIFLRLVQQVQP